MIEYDKLQKSLKHLELQFNNLQILDEDLPVIMKEAVKESTIQRFETCWDCLWKILKKYLEEEMEIAELPNGPKPLIRIANENLLLSSNIENWFKYNQARINTSHDYSGIKAEDALEIMKEFIDDAIELYKTMTNETWKEK